MASWSRTQASYALSSCESELYALGSAAVEVLGIHAFLVNRGFSKEPPVVWGDSSSALQLAQPSGDGSSETRGSSVAGDSILGVNRTTTTTESAQCE